MRLIDELKSLDSTLRIESRCIDPYKTDTSPIIGDPPIAVAFPTTHAQCEHIIEWANKTKTPLILRGAGSGTTAGAIANVPSLVICLRDMNQIQNIDTKNATITCEPGVILKDIHQLAESKGLFYPPDPASLTQCTIGGNIAENAGGPRALKYGVTRDYVIGLKGVWANGEPFEYGGQLKKNVAGYDLIGLLVGSEGTLAIITEITLKLIPKPPIVLDAISAFNSSDEALLALTSVIQSGIHPSTAEFMVDTCMKASIEYMGIEPMVPIRRAAIIWQVDGHTKADCLSQMDRIESVAKGTHFQVLDTQELSDHVWSIRRNMSLGLKQMAGKKHSEDIVVPLAQVPHVIDELEKMQHSTGIQVLGYGHLGDGNIHVNILKMSASDDDWKTHAPDIIASVMALAVRVGGSISGEHGIGRTKKDFMPLVFSDHDLSVMRNIKKIVDPNQILNMGCMFPE